MNDQLENENEDNLKPNDKPVTVLTGSLDNQENENAETASPSTSEVTPDTDLTQSQAEAVVAETLNNGISNQKELPHVEMLNEKIETTKQKTFKLPTESEADRASSTREFVGDDFTKKNEVHILCECEPNVAGAAVPAVTSFIPMQNQISAQKCNRNSCNVPDNITNTDCKSPHKPQTSKCLSPLKNKDPSNHVSRHEPNNSIEKEKKLDSDNTNKKLNRTLRTIEKSSSDVKGYPKKPSLIPKLTRPASNRDDMDKREVRVKSDFQKHFPKSNPNSVKIKDQKTRIIKSIPKTTTEKTVERSETSNTNTISSRMLGLQERLKATTSMLRQKMEMDRSKEKNLIEDNYIDLSLQDISKNTCGTNNKTVDDLYKSISSLKGIASALSESNTIKSQAKYIEKLFLNISEIKLIADKLCMKDPPVKQTASDDNLVEKEKSQKLSTTNTKDNKIYIKFMHAKDRRNETRRKKKEPSPEQSEEVQTDLALGSKLTSESLNSNHCLEKNLEENRIKEADSMDGVFIPSCEPPPNMDDEEETNGLDITITFPEFSQLYADGTESHLSVCLSDISAEALKKLKRCPKDFTLRMDFVEGKVLFQSGKGPANNFQIGPDLKFAENVIDTRKSDVISIKPSTECSFGSQLIPVENAKEIKSFKSLKSTDSELFNVVSLPFLYKNHYLATSHKSCITFRNDQLVSMAMIAKQIFKSMPQIPSLTNIFEDKIMESHSKIDSREEAQESTESKEVD